MKKILTLALSLSVITLKAQVMTISNPDLVSMKLERLSPALRNLPEHPVTDKELHGSRPVHDNPSLEHPMRPINADALPKGADQAVQNNSRERKAVAATLTTLSNWEGISAAVEPSDNNIAVGPNHVVQMANNNVSTCIRIWNKAGTMLVNNKLVSSIIGFDDYGDPNVLYDQAADRYLMVVLYSVSAKKLVVCVSQTPDPTGAYYVYTIATAGGFPDYPKIGVWGNSYFITTNSKAPTIYALNRTAMIAGQSISTAQMFTLDKFPNIGFQSASPITQTGAVSPPAGSPASVIRVADDAWFRKGGSDHLELFNLNINWSNAALSTITGPINLNTIPYNSNLCGFGSGGCIPQPGSTVKLDPLSDIVMDKVQYRNFGTYESVVCSHVCNADGNGTAGVRWYELRKNTSGNWFIYQQSTFAAGTDSRFMPSISINGSGSIALGYNISSTIVYPGMGVTGRNTCDGLNVMSAPEVIAKAGSAASSSNRYGDYNGMVADPSDDSFWFTANYNPTSAWSTNVVHFSIKGCAPQRDAALVDETANRLSLVPNPASEQVAVTYNSNANQGSVLQIMDVTGKIVLQQSQQLATGMNSSAVDIRSLSNGCYFVKMTADDGTSVQRLIIQR